MFTSAVSTVSRYRAQRDAAVRAEVVNAVGQRFGQRQGDG
jgi:hypothetical protein